MWGVENNSKWLNICYFMCYRHGEGYSQLLATFVRTTTVTQLYECCMQLKLLLTRKSSIPLTSQNFPRHPSPTLCTAAQLCWGCFYDWKAFSSTRVYVDILCRHKFLSVKLTELLSATFSWRILYLDSADSEESLRDELTAAVSSCLPWHIALKSSGAIGMNVGRVWSEATKDV